MPRPFVSVNMAMSADGKITSAAREYPTFTSPFDKKTMDRLRAESDAVLVGAGTLRADDPPLTVRDPEMKEHRRSLGKPPGLVNVVVTGSAAIDPDSRFFRDPTSAGRIVATVEGAPAERVAELSRVATVWTLGRGRVDLTALLARLADRGIERLLVEGGGETNWGFLREGLLDEIYVTIAPALFGGREAPTLLEGDGLSMDGRVPLRLVDLARQGDEIYCRYAVVR